MAPPAQGAQEIRGDALRRGLCQGDGEPAAEYTTGLTRLLGVVRETIRNWLDGTNGQSADSSLLDSRQKVSKEQRAELRGVQKSVALALKEEGKTQPQVARLLGVARETIRNWLDATNGQSADSCLLDSRQTVTKEQRQEIYRLASSGQTHVKIADEFRVGRRTIAINIRAVRGPNGRSLYPASSAHLN